MFFLCACHGINRKLLYVEVTHFTRTDYKLFDKLVVRKFKELVY